MMTGLEEDLLAALTATTRIANEAFDDWDADKDHRGGKILGALGNPDMKGYRDDIDTIHRTIRCARKAAASDEPDELKEAGRLWIEAIDDLADMDEHTPERGAVRNTMLDRCDKLEAVFRRILVMP